MKILILLIFISANAQPHKKKLSLQDLAVKNTVPASLDLNKPAPSAKKNKQVVCGDPNSHEIKISGCDQKSTSVGVNPINKSISIHPGKK